MTLVPPRAGRRHRRLRRGDHRAGPSLLLKPSGHAARRQAGARAGDVRAHARRPRPRLRRRRWRSPRAARRMRTAIAVRVRVRPRRPGGARPGAARQARAARRSWRPPAAGPRCARCPRWPPGRRMTTARRRRSPCSPATCGCATTRCWPRPRAAPTTSCRCSCGTGGSRDGFAAGRTRFLDESLADLDGIAAQARRPAGRARGRPGRGDRAARRGGRRGAGAHRGRRVGVRDAARARARRGARPPRARRPRRRAHGRAARARCCRRAATTSPCSARTTAAGSTRTWRQFVPAPERITLPAKVRLGDVPRVRRAMPGGETAGRARAGDWLDADVARLRGPARRARRRPHLAAVAVPAPGLRVRAGAGAPGRAVGGRGGVRAAAGVARLPPPGARRPPGRRAPRLPPARRPVARRRRTRWQAWQEGQTGIPIVDAGMRQLRAEGWMHNRARLITGSFLTKTLYLDWRAGAAHFFRLAARRRRREQLPELAVGRGHRHRHPAQPGAEPVAPGRTLRPGRRATSAGTCRNCRMWTVRPCTSRGGCRPASGAATRPRSWTSPKGASAFMAARKG